MERRADWLPPDHPQRVDLTNEVHARPPDALSAPVRAAYVAVLVGGEERERERTHLSALCEQSGAPVPDAGADHVNVSLGDVRVKWERHTEFSAYSFYADGTGPSEFAAPATMLLPDGWLAAIPGDTIVAAQATLARIEADASYEQALERYFPDSQVVGAQIGDGAGFAFSDLRIHEDGYERFVLLDRGLTPRQAGRITQRLFEIEAYRVMALLALPVARDQAPRTAE